MNNDINSVAAQARGELEAMRKRMGLAKLQSLHDAKEARAWQVRVDASNRAKEAQARLRRQREYEAAQQSPEAKRAHAERELREREARRVEADKRAAQRRAVELAQLQVEAAFREEERQRKKEAKRLLRDQTEREAEEMAARIKERGFKPPTDAARRRSIKFTKTTVRGNGQVFRGPEGR